MPTTNNDIYIFADTQIDHTAKKQMPRKDWLKWLEEKQYTQSEVDTACYNSFIEGSKTQVNKKGLGYNRGSK